jgi:hypothetical protein
MVTQSRAAIQLKSVAGQLNVNGSIHLLANDAAALFASSIIYTYIGEIGSIMDMERLKMRKKPMKGTLYLAITFTTHGSHIVLLGNNANVFTYIVWLSVCMSIGLPGNTVVVRHR